MNIEQELQNMEKQIEEVNVKVERVDEKVDTIEAAMKVTAHKVDRILNIVAGNEYDKNSSLLTQIETLKSDVRKLQDDKIKKDAKLAAYLSMASFGSSILGALLYKLLSH